MMSIVTIIYMIDDENHHIMDFLDTLILLFTLPYPPSYPRLFKKKESVKIHEGSVKGSVKG